MFTFPGNGAVNLVTGAIPIAQNGFTSVATPYGPATTMATGSSNGQNYGTFFCIPSGSSNYSVASLAQPPSTARSQALFCQGDDAGAFTQIAFVMNEDNGPSVSAGKFVFIEYDSGTHMGCATTTAVIDGNYHVYSASRLDTTGNGALYIDGISQSVSQITGSATISTVKPVYVCGNSGSDKACDFPTVFVAVWSRTLSDAEHLAFATNPWQIFRPSSVAWLEGWHFAPPAVADTLMGQMAL